MHLVGGKKQSHYRPGKALGFQEVEAPRFQDNRRMKVVRLSALRTGCLYPQEIFLVLISVRGWEPQGHSAAGRIMSMKNSNDTIGNRTRDLPTCSAVPQPTALPRSPSCWLYYKNILRCTDLWTSKLSVLLSYKFRVQAETSEGGEIQVWVSRGNKIQSTFDICLITC